MRRWTVDSGDDDISAKANATNILIQDSVFHGGLGVAIGSIGQYAGAFERIENVRLLLFGRSEPILTSFQVTVERVSFLNTRYTGYVKTWTGVPQGYPPNGWSSRAPTSPVLNVLLSQLRRWRWLGLREEYQ